MLTCLPRKFETQCDFRKALLIIDSRPIYSCERTVWRNDEEIRTLTKEKFEEQLIFQ